MPTRRLEEIYSRISATAALVLNSCARSTPGPLLRTEQSVPVVVASTPQSLLPQPSPIDGELIEIGLSEEVAREISAKYISNSLKLKRRSEEILRRACAKLSLLPSTSSSSINAQRQRALTRAYEKTYAQTLHSWAEEAKSQARRRLEWHIDTADSSSAVGASCGASPRKKNRPHFNQSYVPVFEFMYGHNPFPSHADKMFLARKSGMTYNQIHVWFQNRRNRAKKESKGRPASSPVDHTVFSFDVLMNKLGERAVPEEDRSKPVDSDASEYEWQYELSDEDESGDDLNVETEGCCQTPFHVDRPSHAFPASYPPMCGNLTIGSFPPLLWNRQPARCIPDRPVPGLEELCIEFTAMRICPSSRKRLVKRKLQSVSNIPKPEPAVCVDVRRGHEVNMCSSRLMRHCAPLPSLVSPSTNIPSSACPGLSSDTSIHTTALTSLSRTHGKVNATSRTEHSTTLLDDRTRSSRRVAASWRDCCPSNVAYCSSRESTANRRCRRPVPYPSRSSSPREGVSVVPATEADTLSYSFPVSDTRTLSHNPLGSPISSRSVSGTSSLSSDDEPYPSTPSQGPVPSSPFMLTQSSGLGGSSPPYDLPDDSHSSVGLQVCADGMLASSTVQHQKEWSSNLGDVLPGVAGIGSHAFF